MTQKSKVLIFGYGSVGKKYAQYFSNKNFDILVFDPFIRIKNSNLKIFKSYNQLSKFINQIDFAIICSLAEDHYPNFCVASDLNIKNILMEKPLTNNFDELSKIKKIIKKKKINFHSNHSWELYNLGLFLKKIQKIYKMGNPLTFISYGGAFCLSTGAIHFYNILIKIFKINIKDVEIHSNLYSSNINPRSKKYKTFGGAVNLSDGKKKKTNIVFNYSNQSKIRTTQTFIYKFHIINFFIDGTYSICRTDTKSDHKKITFLEKTKFVDKGNIYKHNNIFLAAELLLKKKIKIGYESGYNSLIILFSIFISSKYKKVIKLKEIGKYLKKNNKKFLFT